MFRELRSERSLDTHFMTQYYPWPTARELTLFKHQLAAYDNVGDANRGRLRMRRSCGVMYGVRIEDGDVRLHACGNLASVCEAHSLRGEAGHLMNRLLKG